jgi:hypothetical protein
MSIAATVLPEMVFPLKVFPGCAMRKMPVGLSIRRLSTTSLSVETTPDDPATNMPCRNPRIVPP